MKKTLLALAFLLFAASANAQDKLLGILPLNEGKVYYSEIIQAPDIAQAKLFSKAKIWVAENYKSAKDVIQAADEEAGVLLIKGFFEEYWQATFMSSTKVNVYHTLKFSFKDGRYKIEIYDFRINYYAEATTYTSGQWVDMPIETWNKGRNENNKKFYPKVDNSVLATIASIKKYMEKPDEEIKPKKEDW